METIAKTAVKTGEKSSVELFQAASQGVSPWSSFSMWLSMMTMELSTTMPKTMIKAAKETV